MTAALEVNGLRLLDRDGHALVDGVDFSVAQAGMTALVGESGSGKTLIARAVLRLLPPGVTLAAGRVLLDGEDLSALTATNVRRLCGPKIGMVFQEPMVSLNPAMTIGEQMSESLRLHTTLSRAEVRERCLQMLERVEIRDPLQSLSAFPHEFSGGMRQRIMLASAMLLRPKLLIADEPTTALDTLAQREVLDLMLALTQEAGTAVLLITHNLGLVARYARDIVVLRQGRLVETGSARAVLDWPSTEYTRALVDALPKRRTSRPQARGGQPLIRVLELDVTYSRRAHPLGRPRKFTALDRVSLDIHQGETLAVVGGSGSGKTTLGRTIAGLVEPAHGQILFEGQDIVHLRDAARREYRLACQMVFQDPFSSLDPRRSIADTVGEPLRHCREMTDAARRQRAEEILEEVGLAGLGQRFPHELSGGQRQRVAIARAIIRNPKFVVADEPVSALDMTIQQQVLMLLETLQDRHRYACLFISHDLAAVEQVADRIVVMQAGRIVESGTPQQIFDHPRHPYTIALLEAAPRARALVSNESVALEAEALR